MPTTFTTNLMACLQASLLALVVTVGVVQEAAAACSAPPLEGNIPTHVRDALRAQADAVPFSKGLMFGATKGSARVVLIGTMHVGNGDHRMQAIVRAAHGHMEGIDHVLFESKGRKGINRAQPPSYAKDPFPWNALLTLKERQELDATLDQRNVPQDRRHRIHPWVLAESITTPPCYQAYSDQLGVDVQLLRHARSMGIPISGLDWDHPYVYAYKSAPEEIQIQAVRSGLAMQPIGANRLSTLIEGYLHQDVVMARLIIEHVTAQHDRSTRQALYRARQEEALIDARNRAWLPIIDAYAFEGSLMVVAGAAHLYGPQGLLTLLERDGYTIEPIQAP